MQVKKPSGGRGGGTAETLGGVGGASFWISVK